MSANRSRQIGSTVAAAAAFLLVAATAHGQGLDPSAQRGMQLLQTNCARCHAIGRVGESRLRIAPPFRSLHRLYPIETLQESLAEGIVTGHPTMPEYRFEPDQVRDILNYLKTLEN